MSVSNKKRSLSPDISENTAKKFKDFNYSDEDYSDNELQIDMDSNSTVVEKDEFKNIKYISMNRPIKADYINVTSSTRYRCYVKIEELNTSSQCSNILPTASEKYYALLDQAEEILKQKNKITSNDTEIPIQTSKALLVSKYMPKRYTDLISTESSNRLLLGWLKSWDKYVFNRNTKFIEKLKLNVSNNLSNQPYEELLQMDANGKMPAKKVVLIAGAPGLGKTTLATILAKHCGYDAIEINASDDRSPENFRNRISELNSVVTQNNYKPMPTCLILDEIDGAGDAAINVLVNAIIATSDNKSNKDISDSPAQKKKKQLAIRRPIICICNDLYAPSLRQLRPLSYIIKIVPPDFNQLLHRLGDICTLEDIDCDRSLLTNIIDISNRDIRSCLNTLQFLQHQGSLNPIDNDKSVTSRLPINIGQKDIETNIFKIWQDIFTEPNLKKSYMAISGQTGRDLTARLQHILQISHSSGDLDKVINGIFENYLSIVSFKDIFLQGMVDGTEWMVFNDLSNRLIDSIQLYDMYKYKQYLIPFFHLSFASAMISPERIQWPMSEANHRQKIKKIQSIYDTFVFNQGSIKNWIQCRRAVIESVLPQLIHIIRPIQLRPINSQLYSTVEKEMLQNTVNVMLSTGLGYLQIRLTDLQYQYVLNPNIEEIVRFDIINTTQKELTYATKQLIANEVNRERIKMSNRSRYESLEVGNVAPEPKEQSNNRIGFILQKANEMKQKSTIISANPYRESFNFRLGPKPSSKVNMESNSISSILNQPVWFKFKEGFSNAIRRPVKMRDL